MKAAIILPATELPGHITGAEDRLLDQDPTIICQHELHLFDVSFPIIQGELVRKRPGEAIARDFLLYHVRRQSFNIDIAVN